MAIEEHTDRVYRPFGQQNGVLVVEPETGFSWLEYDQSRISPEGTQHRNALLLGCLPAEVLAADQDGWFNYLLREAERKWSPLAGTRVSADQMRALPSKAELETWEDERLRWEPERIWSDDTIPSKIRRKLLLEKLGFHLDSHFFIPGEIAYGCLTALILKLRRSREKSGEGAGLGISTASMEDRLMGRMPSLRISANVEDDDIKDVVSKYGDELESMCGNDWSKFMLHIYPNPWDDKGFVAGARLRVESDIASFAGEPFPHFLEIIPEWPRAIDTSVPGVGHYYRRRGTVIQSPFFGAVVRDMGVEEKMPQENALMIYAAKDRIDASLRDPETRANISRLQRVVGTNDVTLDICFHIDTKGGRNLYWFDFDAAVRNSEGI